MKTLFKFIFGLILFVVLLVGGLVAIVYFNLKDSTNNTPYELYTNEVTKENQMSLLMDEAFDLEEKNFVNFTLTEDEINKLIYAIIKDKANPEYAPSKTCKQTSCKAIKSIAIPSNIPLLGGKEIMVLSVYATLSSDALKITMPLDIAGIKSKFEIKVSITTEETEYVLVIKSLKLGKFNVTKGLGKSIVDLVLKSMKQNNESISDNLSSQTDLEIQVDLKKYEISITKDSINKYIKDLMKPEEGEVDSTLGDLTAMLTDPTNDIIEFGNIGTEFGIKFNLSKLEVNDETKTLDPSVKTFDEELYISNKTQSFVFSNLVSGGNTKIFITDKDFNAILYNRSNAYEAFKVQMDIPSTTAQVKFEVKGVVIDFNAADVVILLIVDLNGLTTSIEVVCDITQNNNETVILKLKDTLTIGKNVDETTTDYLTANSSFVTKILSEQISDLGFLVYNASTNCFEINASSFEEMMKVEGTTSSPLNVDKINVVDGNIEVYTSITNTSPIYSQLQTVTTVVNDVLENTEFSTSDFITAGDQADVVINVIDAIEDVSSGITSGTLTEEDTQALIENVNSLSSENQQKLFEKIETIANSSELEALYGSLFGK